MTEQEPVRRTLHLQAAPTSPGAARRFVRRLLADADRGEWSDAASLAISELVTNAVLHAHSDIEVIGDLAQDHLRLEVRDDNPLLPSARSYDDHATTGRGLDLVAGVTTAHGVESLGPQGKVVWCCIGGHASGGGPDADGPGEWADTLELTTAGARAEPQQDAVEVVLLQMPATLWLAARGHHDALLRELALLRGSSDRQPASTALAAEAEVAALDEARSRLDAAVDADLERARRAGAASVPLPLYHPGALPSVPDTMDLRVHVRPSEAQAYARMQDALDAGERLAIADQLLVRPALPEIVAVRDWACEQVIAQVAGSPPAPWQGADDASFTADVEPDAAPQGWEDHVTGADVGLIAVDESNRIIALSAPLAHVLGWPVGDLVGRRVVAIVPPRFREAHVAGFSRHLSTGDARALGVELDLPVLHADGTEVDCRFFIESTSTPGGRVVYTARITPVDQLHPSVG